MATAHPEQPNMVKFLANDFEMDRWKTAALKNAYALLGKQRYEYAASFFLLAGKLSDAVGVCLKQLQDPQLAITLCRLYEGERGPVLADIMANILIPNSLASGDRWLSCVLFSLDKKLEHAFYSVNVNLSLT